MLYTKEITCVSVKKSIFRRSIEFLMCERYIGSSLVLVLSVKKSIIQRSIEFIMYVDWPSDCLEV